MPSSRKTVVGKVHRQGPRPPQKWVSDPHAPGFAEEARRQSSAVAASNYADDDQAFIDSISEFDEERPVERPGFRDNGEEERQDGQRS